MTRAFEEAVARWGLPATVEHGGESVQTRAFLQPLRREQVKEPFSVTPLGAAEERLWRYLGSAETAIAMGDVVTAAGRRYRVRSAAEEYLGGSVAYRWALLVPEEAAV